MYPPNHGAVASRPKSVRTQQRSVLSTTRWVEARPSDRAISDQSARFNANSSCSRYFSSCPSWLDLNREEERLETYPSRRRPMIVRRTTRLDNQFSCCGLVSAGSSCAPVDVTRKMNCSIRSIPSVPDCSISYCTVLYSSCKVDLITVSHGSWGRHHVENQLHPAVFPVLSSPVTFALLPRRRLLSVHRGHDMTHIACFIIQYCNFPVPCCVPSGLVSYGYSTGDPSRSHVEANVRNAWI